MLLFNPDPVLHVGDILRGALQKLKMYGRTTGMMRESDGKFCALGALIFTRQEMAPYMFTPGYTAYPETFVLMRAIEETGFSIPALYLKPGPVEFAYCYNDAEGRTDEEVYAVFERAIELAEEADAVS